MPHKKPIASETDARKMKSSARLGGLKEAPASIGGEYFTSVFIVSCKNHFVNGHFDGIVQYTVHGRKKDGCTGFFRAAVLGGGTIWKADSGICTAHAWLRCFAQEKT